MRDYGFVEQYPQRWNFDYSWLMFEVDEVFDDDGENTGGLEVIWFSDPPEFHGRHFLHGELKRLQRMYDDVLAKAALLDSSHEKRVIVNFYDSLSTALDVAIISSTAISQEEEEEELYASNYKVLLTKMAKKYVLFLPSHMMTCLRLHIKCHTTWIFVTFRLPMIERSTRWSRSINHITKG